MADSILKQIGVVIATKITSVQTELQTNIDTEETARIALAADLDDRLDQIEIQTQTQAVGVIGYLQDLTTTSQENIVAAINELDAYIETNTDNIASETATRLTNDNALQTNINNEEVARIAADTTLTSGLTSEAATRLANDNSLQSNIDSEAETRLANDTTIQNTLLTNITNEETARIAADAALTDDLSSETASRLAADNALQSNIDTEETARIAANTNLTNSLASEATTRLANDNTLQSNINSEAATRLANDNTLQSNISSLDNLKFDKVGGTVTGHVLPGTDITYDLGSSNKQWKDFYVSNITTVGSIVVGGNLTVSGTTTFVDTETLNIANNYITLNSTVTGTPTENASLIVERGSLADAVLLWNEGRDKWQVTSDGVTYYDIARDGDVLNIASPGSGIIFNGTTTVNLHAINDDTDSIMNFDGATELRVNNDKVWTEANDGIDSGLDADKLDGLEGSNYIRYYEQSTAPSSAPSGSIWKDTDDDMLYMAANENNVLSWFEI